MKTDSGVFLPRRWISRRGNLPQCGEVGLPVGSPRLWHLENKTPTNVVLVRFIISFPSLCLLQKVPFTWSLSTPHQSALSAWSAALPRLWAIAIPSSTSITVKVSIAKSLEGWTQNWQTVEIDEVEAKVKQHNPEVLVSPSSGFPSIRISH